MTADKTTVAKLEADNERKNQAMNEAVSHLSTALAALKKSRVYPAQVGVEDAIGRLLKALA